MFDFSYMDPRLLFPNITEGWALAIESLSNLLSLVSFILVVVAEWRLFRKLSEKPWKSLVPYYNSYILYKHSWSKKSFWIYFISTMLFDLTQSASKYLSQNQPDNMWMTLLVLISLPFGIVAAVCSILYAIRLAETFGKGKIFSAGLVLLYPVFISILGLGKSQYVDNHESKSSGIDTENPKREGK